MRYAIKNPQGLLYSGSTVPKVEPTLVPGTNPPQINYRHWQEPVFKGVDASSAVKFDTAADATAMLTHPDLVDAQAFSGCTVVEVELA